MPLPVSSVHHVAILVEDLEKAERFYAGLLGLHVDKRWPDEKGGTRSVWLAAGGTIVMLERATPSDARRGEMGGGWHVVAFRIHPEDRKEVERQLAAAGVAIESRTDYTLYVRDPEGNRVAFSHWPDKPAP
ncbi:MAG TPA: VOC family protein [bacterium]|nr:VOC family protein [bacterium]